MSMIYDVLVIGSGGAGLSAALEAKKYSSNIAVISKTHPTSSQTCQAQGGINAVLNSNQDSVDSHIKDTIKAGNNLQNNKAIEIMCKNASETINWLDELGVPFSRDINNNISQRNFGGASYPRTCYSSDYTGLKILNTLYDSCIKEDITFINEHYLISFIKDENTNTIVGINTIDLFSGKLLQFFAKSIIIASGGYAGIYNDYTTNSTATTGETLTHALNIGCQLENMEFVQFHPTTLKESKILISESTRGEGGYLVDQNGKRFVDELKTRDEVARAIYKKIEEGNQVFLDLKHISQDTIKKNMPQEYQIIQQFTGLKLDTDLIEITPSAHYTMGGIKVDIDGKTNIKNLFACGECASNRVHGANRLGGNSLLEIITFGRVTGKNASLNTNSITSFNTSKYSNNYNSEQSKITEIFTLPNTINYQDIKRELGEKLFEKVGLFRDDKSLHSILKDIKEWKQNISKMGITDKSEVYNTDLKEFLEFKSMLELAHTIVLSALSRCESRGAHYRTDYLEKKQTLETSTIVKKTNDKIEVTL